MHTPPPDRLLTAPENFSMVVNGIYRSSFPRAENFEFLKTIKLKSVLVLISEPYPEENIKFLEEMNIQFFRVGMSGNKEPFVHGKLIPAVVAIIATTTVVVIALDFLLLY